MKTFRNMIAALLLLFMMAGCATVKTDREWGKLKEIAYERSGEEIVWEQSEAEEQRIQNEVGRLLADGLSRDDAVRIALINNRQLQRAFEEVGISKSDLIQAGLFSNPSLDVLFRFPSGGGRTNIEATALIPISDLWKIPFRKKVASARMEATILHTGQIVIETAAEAKRSYDIVYYLSMSEKEMKEILRKFRELSDQVSLRKDFGFMSDQDVYLSQIMVFEAELELARIQSELATTKIKLNRVMGLKPSRMNYEFVLREEHGAFANIPDLERGIQYALDHRLEVRMAKFRILQAEKALELERMRVFKHVGLGASYERDVEGTSVFGPAVDIQLPLFDQNQAQVARAQYRIRQERRRLQALEGQIREEVAKDLERISLFQTRKQSFGEKIIPLREKILEYAEKWVRAMQLNRLSLLEAERGLLQSRKEYLGVLKELQHTLVDLELHLGGRLP
jgi:cobalt-zinc-cadmium efflux system outer membrane protein